MANSAKIWIISRTGWEYDDSRYYRPESDGSHPVSAFTFPELARQICDEKNAAEMRDIGSRGVGDYVDRWDIDSDADKEFQKDNFLDEDFEFTKPISEIPDEILIRVMNHYNMNFYEVIEVDLLS